ncbi:MAG: leucine--tRNA ligase [Proteobacteria bacterium]|nr:leucine--tRNA ligase [Pseudomonadota bacterium]
MYPFKQVEQKWQKIWEEKGFFPKRSYDSPKAYILEMFPYPSGRLHMGHVRNYAIGDAIARFKNALGYNVLHPMGWDAFGLPAENAAIQHNASPKTWTYENIEAMKKDCKSLGFAFDWDLEITTCSPDYYGYEQKIFLDFYQKGLVYRKESWVNWDPIEQTVLANEQVINGRGWRSNALVEKRKLNQWSVKITAYGQELLQDLSKLQGWPDKVLKMQEKWIGYSEGCTIHFNLAGQTLTVYTTRPETLFGASFIGIAATHPLAECLSQKDEALAAFIRTCQQTPTTEEALSTAEKLGYNTGLYVEHPFDPNTHLPIYVANFVLMDYGTGAIFACPAHDERDYDFAQKYHLPIKAVINDQGLLINSSFLNGLKVAEAKAKVINELEKKGQGEKRIQYRLRDWCVSRQRYWGCPIPIIHCEKCGIVPEQKLPVLLPDDVVFGQGNPLASHPTWKHVNCPLCGGEAERDTDTLDTFFESSWYFLRFCNPFAHHPTDKEACKKWLPVDWYIGGIEHAVLHLLYARFFTKALRDCGYLELDEPFQHLLTQGMVCHQTFQDQKGKWLFPSEVMKNSKGDYVTVEGGYPVIAGRSEKMSKSKKNLIDPQTILDVYGADVARLFVLSDTPCDKDFDWNDEGLDGAWRYLNRLWRLGHDVKNFTGPVDEDLKLRKQTHQLLKRIQEAYLQNGFNRVIAFVRELTNILEDHLKNSKGGTLKETFDVIVQTLSPITPHLCCELWDILGHPLPLSATSWPEFDPKLAEQETVVIAVQVNGKLRGQFETTKGTEKQALEQQAFSLNNVVKDIGSKTIKKVIVVPDRIVNIVC